MDILQRAGGFFTQPRKEWAAIQKEKASVGDLFLHYAAILAAIPAVAQFLGYSVIGIRVYGRPDLFRYSFESSLGWAVTSYALALVGVYVEAVLIDLLAPSFGAKRNIVSSTKVAVFASTPWWLGGMLHLTPSLLDLRLLLGIYSLVLLYMGIETVKHPPKEKMAGYYILLLLTFIAIDFLTARFL